MSRKEDILSDVAAMRIERLGLLGFIKVAIPQEAAIAQRRVDKIEERFAEIGLNESGFERAK